jgi:surface carbohydrate biosynthesis protein (TIGR04326 family)
VESSVVPDTQVATKGMKSFNESSERYGLHAFIDGYITWGVVLRVLRDWLKLIFVSFHLRGIQDAFCPSGSYFSLWPLMQDDWRTSLRGPVAVSNLLWIELFDQALGDLPYQRTGLYLCENQSWEKAFIYAWRKFGHGQLIAVPHSTIRFWDLRYFTDPRTIRLSAEYKIPKADATALNGKQAVNAYLSANFPKEEIVECEALRFGYLTNLRAKMKSRQGRSNKRTIRVLVLGDFSPSTTNQMLRLLEGAVPHISDPISYTLKPHPGFMVNPEDYPSLNLKIVTNSLDQILEEFDIAYSANTTSAAVDVCYAGLPVVVMLDEEELNFCPLRGKSGVRFVSESKELAEALQGEHHDFAVDIGHDEFFFLDAGLSRWKQLLLGNATS